MLLFFLLSRCLDSFETKEIKKIQRFFTKTPLNKFRSSSSAFKEVRFSAFWSTDHTKFTRESTH